MTFLIGQCSTVDYHLSQISRKYFSLATSHITLSLEQSTQEGPLFNLGMLCETGILIWSIKLQKRYIDYFIINTYASVLMNLCTLHYCRGSLMLAKVHFHQYGQSPTGPFPSRTILSSSGSFPVLCHTHSLIVNIIIVKKQLEVSKC